MRVVCAVRSNPAVFFKNKIDELKSAWDAGFRMSFQDFREGLKKIAEYNRSRMRPRFQDVLAHPSVVLQQIMDQPGNLVFPTDDDDWFHKEAISCVVDVKPTGFARWNYTELMLGRVVRILDVQNDWGPYYRYQCNNYAIVTPNQHEFLKSHHPDISGNMPEDETKIAMNLSMHNKTPASISHPRRFSTPEELISQVNNYIKNAESASLPEYSNEMDMLVELLRKARPRKIHL